MTQDSDYPAPKVAWSTVVVLSFTYMFSYMDRQILVLLIEPIKTDLQISDTQVSLLTGLAFALVYAVSGIPMGRIADRWVRKYVILIGVTIWSVLTMYCGFARNFVQLFLARMGVGFGEAALTPTAYAMIADLFPPKRLALGMSVFAMGGTIGAGLALLFGGLIVGHVSGMGSTTWPLIGEVRSWQLVLIVVGGASLLMVIPLSLIPEPKRHSSVKILENKNISDTEMAGNLPFNVVLLYVWSNRSFYLRYVVGASLINLYVYGGNAWLPSFLIRVHEWEAASAGITLGLLSILPGIFGAIFGGYLADRFFARGYPAAALVIKVLALALAIFLIPIFIYSPWMELRLLTYVILVLIFTGYSVLSPTILQMATPNHIRAQVSAIYLLVANLVGIGFGPTVVALITDFVFADNLAVGHSIAVVGIVTCTLGALILLSAIKPFKRQVQDVLGVELEGGKTKRSLESNILAATR